MSSPQQRAVPSTAAARLLARVGGMLGACPGAAWVAVATAAALACHPADGRTAGARGAPAPAAPPATAERRAACPSREFGVFLAAFAESALVQEAFTRFPLRMRSLVDADPEPRQLETVRARADVRLPVFPSEASRKAVGLVELRVAEDGAALRRVVLRKPDTDHQLVFVFERGGDCWRLVLVDDQSL